MFVWIMARLWLRLMKNKARHSMAMARQQAQAETAQMHATAERQVAEMREAFDFATREKERRLDARTAEIAVRQNDLDRREQRVDKHAGELEKRLRTLETDAAHYRDRLRELSGLDEKEVRARLREDVALQCQRELAQLRNELLSKSETQLHEEAKRVLVACMQRVSMTVPQELGASIVRLPSEDFKGRIIGKEGRNIRCFESATGTTLMIDESPETVLVSSFDPVRREVARIALENLIADGRIHPATIEAAVQQADELVKGDVYSFGEKAVERLGLSGVPRDIVAHLGRLHYHLSNNQNTLEHAIEVASICGLLAAELGLDVDIAKRAGLFHDIGKAVTEDLDQNHAEAGAALLKRHGMDERVVNAVAAHHEETVADSIYGPLVMIADRLSATRPGARASAIDGYIARVQALEAIAKTFEGVSDAYALQAGREIRVMVEPEQMSDIEAGEMARQLREHIERDLTYPGSIKITVIRERRYTELAK